jgi:single-strand DNA-binding protein
MLNKVVIMGRLTRDPEIKYTQSQLPVVTISVAVDRDYAKQSEQRETDFLTVVAWRNTAEFIAKWFHKGSMIVVEGKLQTRKWQDKYEQKRTEIEILADNVWFGESRNAQATIDNHVQNYAAPAPAPAYTDDFRPLEDSADDVPF